MPHITHSHIEQYIIIILPMFCKKTQPVELPSISKPPPKDSAQLKELNHEFFLLVRDQKYEEAYALGTMYLQFHPENQAIQQFCHFIKYNREQLLRMVDEEMNYTDGESEDEEEDSQGDSDEDDNESVASSVSDASSKASSMKGKSISSISSNSVKSIKSVGVRQAGGKENGELCRGHKWDHNCKNKDCPNRKKQQAKK